MRSPGSLKQEFLRKWLKGLQVYSSTTNEMSILERKRVIKLSADMAMASTRIHSNSKFHPSWSRALMAKASNDATNEPILSRVFGSDNDVLANTLMIPKVKDSAKRNLMMMMMRRRNKRIRSKKILRKMCSNKMRRMRRKAAHVVDKGRNSNVIAKRIVMKRTQVLQRLVPGGEFMDESSLIKETLDYILSLRLQVDVMRHLANISEKLDNISRIPCLKHYPMTIQRGFK